MNDVAASQDVNAEHLDKENMRLYKQLLIDFCTLFEEREKIINDRKHRTKDN